MKKLIIFFVCLFIVACTGNNIPQNKLNNFSSKLDQMLFNESYRLEKIAAKANCSISQWNEIKQLLISSKQPEISCVSWYAEADGSYYTTLHNKAKHNLLNREYFPLLLNKEKIYGWPVVSKSTKKKAIVTAVPIIIENKVCGIIGSSIFLEDLWDYLKKNYEMDHNFDFYALDSDGTAIFDLERKEFIFDNPLLQASISLRQAVKKIISSESGTVKYRWADKNKIAIYKKSKYARWRYVLSYY